MKKAILEHEILHGRKIAGADPECIWGWGTPAGRIRARRRANLITARAELQPEHLVLEIGCGTGLFTEYFAQSGARLVAVDISDELIVRARRRNLPPDRVRFVVGAFEDCDLAGPFDAVIGSSILHHLELRMALRKVHDLLKPGGAVSFAEPNMLNPQILIQKNVAWLKKRWGDSPDETAFFSWEMASLLEEVGFQAICVTPFDWLHPAVPEALIRPVSRIGSLLEKVPVLRQFSGSLHIAARRSPGHPQISPIGSS